MQREAIAMLFAASLLGGCKMGNAVGPVPSKTDHLELPAGTSTARVLDCAEAAIAGFAKGNSDWLPVARKDAAAGVLESRDFKPANIVGFRVRVTVPTSGASAIQLKAAGPYFMDLGAEKAMTDFKAAIRRCLGS